MHHASTSPEAQAPVSEQDKIVNAIAALEAQRDVLGDVAVDAALSGLRQRLAGQSQFSHATQPSLASGERKLVTIMFADVTEFTALSETLEPERVRALMNACFNALVPCIEKYGGIVDKFVGD
jgi:class 3 adenylate cyclase